MGGVPFIWRSSQVCNDVINPQAADTTYTRPPEARKRLKDPLLWRKLACGDFARLVMLTGHGSMTANNRHASGFDCGASGVTSIRGSLTQLPAHAIFD
ncbi:MAG: putative inorganic carbon transporter subunit DabA [Rhodomicrobium sp.]